MPRPVRALEPDQPTWRRLRWTTAFLLKLKENGNVAESCRAAGVARPVVYALQKSDPDFAERWQDAVDEAIDSLELAAVTRARDGVPNLKFTKDGDAIIDPRVKGPNGEPVFYEERQYSDTLTALLLKAHRPAIYRDNPKVSINFFASTIEQEALQRGIDPKDLLEGVYRVLNETNPDTARAD